MTDQTKITRVMWHLIDIESAIIHCEERFIQDRYFCSCELSGVHDTHNDEGESWKKSESETREMPPEIRKLFTEITEIRGIIHVVATPYRLMLEKGHMFQWNPIQHKIDDILSEYAGGLTIQRHERDDPYLKGCIPPEDSPSSGSGNRRRLLRGGLMDLGELLG